MASPEEVRAIGVFVSVCRNLEQALKTEHGATGNGIHQCLISIGQWPIPREPLFPRESIKLMQSIRHWRNRLVHDHVPLSSLPCSLEDIELEGHKLLQILHGGDLAAPHITLSNYGQNGARRRDRPAEGGARGGARRRPSARPRSRSRSPAPSGGGGGGGEGWEKVGRGRRGRKGRQKPKRGFRPQRQRGGKQSGRPPLLPAFAPVGSEVLCRNWFPRRSHFCGGAASAACVPMRVEAPREAPRGRPAVPGLRRVAYRGRRRADRAAHEVCGSQNSFTMMIDSDSEEEKGGAEVAMDTQPTIFLEEDGADEGFVPEPRRSTSMHSPAVIDLCGDSDEDESEGEEVDHIFIARVYFSESFDVLERQGASEEAAANALCCSGGSLTGAQKILGCTQTSDEEGGTDIGRLVSFNNLVSLGFSPQRAYLALMEAEDDEHLALNLLRGNAV